MAQLIKITGEPGMELACGYCYSILLGYDEVICPSCGRSVDMDNVKEMTIDEVCTKCDEMASHEEMGGGE